MKLARRVLNLNPSPTLAITARAKAMRAEGKDVIDLGVGEPDFDTPKNIKDAAVKAISEGFTKYTKVGGIDELKDAIIEKLKRDNGLEYRRDEIIVSCGAKHVLYNLAQVLFEEGDEVIIPAPYWVSYPPIVELAGAVPVFIYNREEEGFKINPGALREAITSKTKALILNSPCNPTGAVYTMEDLIAIYNVIKGTDCLVISDEIYEKLLYDDLNFISFANIGRDAKERTIIVNGLSKSYSMTGWRIGYAAGNRAIIRAMTDIQSQSTSNPTSIAQKAGVEALRGSQEDLCNMVKEFDRRRRYVVERLNSIRGISCTMPQGAFYVFPRISDLFGSFYKGKGISSSKDLVSLFLEEIYVSTVSGDDFGAPGYIRISYATSIEELKRGLDRIEGFIRELE